MTIKKHRIKLFQITGITNSSITHFSYKIPRELINITGILINTGASPKAPSIPGCKLGSLTIHFNNKKTNILQRYAVLGYKALSKKLKPLSLNEDVEAGSLINAVYQDIGLSADYPYIVTVYLYGTIEKEIIK